MESGRTAAGDIPSYRPPRCRRNSERNKNRRWKQQALLLLLVSVFTLTVTLCLPSASAANTSAKDGRQAGEAPGPKPAPGRGVVRPEDGDLEEVLFISLQDIAAAGEGTPSPSPAAGAESCGWYSVPRGEVQQRQTGRTTSDGLCSAGTAEREAWNVGVQKEYHHGFSHELDRDGITRAGVETQPREDGNHLGSRSRGEGREALGGIEGQAYIVSWVDYHPVEEHEQLLARAWGAWGECLYFDAPDGVADRDGGGGGGGGEPFAGGGKRGAYSVLRSDSGGADKCTGVVGDFAEETIRLFQARSPSFSGHGEDDGEGGGIGDGSRRRRCSSWRWKLVEGRNVATAGKFPSDFSVVRLVRQREQPSVVTPSPEDVQLGSSDKEREALRTGGDRAPDEPTAWRTEKEIMLEALRRSDLVKNVSEEKALNRGTASTEDPKRVQRTPPDLSCVGSDHASETTAKPDSDSHAHETRKSESSGNPCVTKATTKARRVQREPAEPLSGAQRGLEGGAARAALRGSSRRFVDASEKARPLHDQGFRGAGIRVAVFDTGLEAGGHDFSNVVERINWTDEETLSDTVGHGTHIAGVIAGRDPGCSGLAPDALLHVFRVFSSEQVSYTSWFLDTFNYALFRGINVINLSIGGPDFLDQPFVDKVRELSAHGVVIVSAVGNDGPGFGTQHNPADQTDTIGVGAIGSLNGAGVASFQSRGMTTWELPGGYGRVKPDLVAAGHHVLGPTAGEAAGKCSGLSGTSVASPVVAGAVALLASTVPVERRAEVLSPASIKQVLVESAHKVKRAGVFEQGAGALDIEGAFRLLQSYTPRASLLPPTLDLTDPFMWPFSRQPLYYGAMPVVFNVTIANGLGVTGHIASIAWREEIAAGFHDEDILDVRAEFPEALWPWSGYLAVSLSVSESGRSFDGIVSGHLEVTVVSEGGTRDQNPRSTDIRLPITTSVIRTPPRHRRLLWDQYHNVPYPPEYSPRDYLGDDSDMLDRLGDHPHTNFRSLFDALLDAGYYLEILGSDWTCFEAENYGAILVVDTEGEISAKEMVKLERDVKRKGLSLVVFADWYSADVMHQVRFVDDNTRMPWRPVTGGSNVPAINDFLLSSFGMALGGTVLDGVFALPGGKVHLASGNAIARLPPGGIMISVDSMEAAVVAGGGRAPSLGDVFRDVPVIGALDTKRLPSEASSTGAGGRVFLFGDSSCADDAALGKLELLGANEEGGRRTDCLWLFKSAVRYACEGYEDPGVFRHAIEVTKQRNGGEFESRGLGGVQSFANGFSDGMPLPERSPDSELLRFPSGGVVDTHDMAQDSCDIRRWRDVPGAAARRL